MTLSEELKWRGLIKDTTIDDLSVFDNQQWSLYCGFDASAPSQTIGNLAALLAVKTFLRYGHKAVLVAGGATTLIGDPGGKTGERQLQTPKAIAANIEILKTQIDTVLSGYDYELVNNLDWLGQLKIIDWLRDVGKKFSMSQLVKRDYIAQRLGDGGSGISYAEFSYSLLQAYDFWHLFKNHNCRLQIGGADQWGNCIAGVELIQKLEQQRAEVITLPLVINQATGQKFGKSESGAIWLNRSMTSPYDFYQFWINCDDDGLEQYLKSFTELDRPTIDNLIDQQKQNSSDRPGQKALAESVTKLIHGPTTNQAVSQLSQLLFEDKKPEKIAGAFVSTLTRKQIAKAWQLNDHDDLLTVLVDRLQIASSRRDAKQFITNGGIRVVGQKTTVSVTANEQSMPASQFFQQRVGAALTDSECSFWLINRGKNQLGVVWI